MKTNLQKQLSERDKKVQVRNDMLRRLYEAVEQLNDGNRNPLSKLLCFINNEYKNGFTVDTKPQQVFEFFGQHYGIGDELLIIKENDKDLIAIFKIKAGECAGDYRVTELDYYEFLDDDYFEAEAQWERDSERAMNNYYEGRANGYFYDDPRGQ